METLKDIRKKQIRKMMRVGDSVARMSRTLNLSRATIYHYYWKLPRYVRGVYKIRRVLKARNKNGTQTTGDNR